MRSHCFVALLGTIYASALFYSLAAEGKDAALFFGTIDFGFSFPVLLLTCRFLALGINRVRPMGSRVDSACSSVLILSLSGLLAHDGYQARDPLVQFARRVVSPVPASVRVVSAFNYKGFNFSWWAFHFTVSPEDLPRILRKYPYKHEVNSLGFDLSEVQKISR